MMIHKLSAAPSRPVCCLKPLLIFLLAFVASCSSHARLRNSGSPAPPTVPVAAPSATNGGSAGKNVDSTAASEPFSESKLIGAIDATVLRLQWPIGRELTAKALWDSKLKKAAGDTILTDVDAAQIAEAWNLCAWMLEVRDSVTARDLARAARASIVLSELPAKLAYTSAGTLLSDAALEGRSGKAETASSFIEANDCEKWPVAGG